MMPQILGDVYASTLGGGRTDGRKDGKTEGQKPKTMSLRFSSKRRGTISISYFKI